MSDNSWWEEEKAGSQACKKEVPKPASKPDDAMNVSDNTKASWLMRLACNLEYRSVCPPPQSFTRLRILSTDDPVTYQYSLAGVLCQMYLVSPEHKEGLWENDRFTWIDRAIGHDGCVQQRSSSYAVPEPVLWWAFRQIGGYDATLLIEQERSVSSFTRIAQTLRELDRYYVKLQKDHRFQQAFQANNQPDQAMRNARRLQERVKQPKKKSVYDF